MVFTVISSTPSAQVEETFSATIQHDKRFIQQKKCFSIFLVLDSAVTPLCRLSENTLSCPVGSVLVVNVREHVLHEIPQIPKCNNDDLCS